MSTASHEVRSACSEMVCSVDDNTHESALEDRETNARVGACRLPPELIADIFMSIQISWLPRREHWSGNSSFPNKTGFLSGRMLVLHVCSFWRRVALSSPMLWQDIDAMHLHPDSAHEILTRSADLSLRLKFLFHSVDDPQHPASLATVSRDIWLSASAFRRLQTLDIICAYTDTYLPHLLTQEAPNLEKLELSVYLCDSLPPNLLGSSYPPKLCHLRLRANTLPFDVSLFAPTLTYLHLAWANLGTGYRFPVARVLTIISTLPVLEYLYLCYLRLSASTDIPLRKVVCPSTLKHISMDMNIDEDEPYTPYVSFWKHLSTPTTTDIVVSVTFAVEEWDHPACTQIFSTVFADNLEGRQCYEFDFKDWHNWDLYRWDPRTKLRMGRRRLTFPSIDSMPYAEDAVYFIAFIHPQSLVFTGEFCKQLCLPEADNPDPPPVPLVNILAEEEVRCLTINYQDHHYLWPVLSSQPMPFPHLTTIILTSLHRPWKINGGNGGENFVTERPVEQNGIAEASLFGDLTSGLMKAVESMRRAAVPIQEVRIEGEPAKWDGWDEVRSVIKVVEV